MTTSELFKSPNQNRYFEDYVEGDIHTFGSVVVDEAEIIEFARRYDPQVFHVDVDKAMDSIYGGLIASGWHTASIMMSLLAPYYLSDVSSLGSPGLNDLRWRAPVRPGDTLSVRVTISETRLSASKPDRGIVNAFMEALNQHGDVVMDFSVTNLWRAEIRNKSKPGDHGLTEWLRVQPFLDFYGINAMSWACVPVSKPVASLLPG